MLKKLKALETQLTLAQEIAFIVMFALFGVGTVLLINKVANNRVYASCTSQGKDIVTDYVNNEMYCIEKYSDGGKSCETSLDCEGRCYIQAEGESPTCEYDNSPIKCVGTLSDAPRNCDLTNLDYNNFYENQKEAKEKNN